MVPGWLLLFLVRAGSFTIATSGWARHPYSVAILVQAQGCGSSMAVNPSTSRKFRASTCRRWGDVGVLSRVARREARRHYFARLAKRSLRDRRPALPLGGKPCALLCSSPVAAPEHPPGLTSSRAIPRCDRSRSRERVPALAVPRSVDGARSVCPSLIFSC